MQSTETVQTLRMWVKTLNPSWIEPSPDPNLRALKVPTLRASLGITGFGHLWNGQSGLEQCKIHDWSLIHYRNGGVSRNGLATTSIRCWHLERQNQC